MNLLQTILNSIITIVVLFNLVYSASSSYKESVTDEDNQKTINGYLLALFGIFAGFGNAVYRVIRKVSQAVSKDKKSKEVDLAFAGIIDFWIVFGLSYILYIVFNLLGASDAIEDMSVIEKVLNVGKYVVNTFVMIMYYGFVFGLFGGDNCRIQETFLSGIFNKIKSLGDSLETVDTEISIKTVKEDINKEIESVKTTGKGTKIDVLQYLKSSVGRFISTLAEFCSSVTSVYVSFRNIITLLQIVITNAIFSLVMWFANRGEESELAYGLEVLEDISEIFTNLFWSLVILLIIKILVKIVLNFLPESISESIYAGSSSLTKKYKDKLSKMSADNLTSDSFAMKNTPDKLLRAARMASGNKI